MSGGENETAGITYQKVSQSVSQEVNRRVSKVWLVLRMYLLIYNRRVSEVLLILRMYLLINTQSLYTHATTEGAQGACSY